MAAAARLKSMAVCSKSRHGTGHQPLPPRMPSSRKVNIEEGSRSILPRGSSYLSKAGENCPKIIEPGVGRDQLQRRRVGSVESTVHKSE